ETARFVDRVVAGDVEAARCVPSDPVAERGEEIGVARAVPGRGGHGAGAVLGSLPREGVGEVQDDLVGVRAGVGDGGGGEQARGELARSEERRVGKESGNRMDEKTRVK